MKVDVDVDVDVDMGTWEDPNSLASCREDRKRQRAQLVDMGWHQTRGPVVTSWLFN